MNAVRQGVKNSAGFKAVQHILKVKEMGILGPLIIICIIAEVSNPVFLGPSNIIDLLRSISFTCIVAVGATFILIGGGLDLSVGSVIGLSGMIVGGCLVAGIPIIPSILISLFVGAVIGFINGFIVVKFHIPPMIVTLGMMYIARGIVYVISKGRSFSPFPDAFNQLGQGTLLGVPYSVYIAFVVLLIGYFLLNHTTFGRSIYAVGGNEEAARVSGINIGKVKILTYCITSFLCGMTGILMAARLSSAQANAGTGWEMTIIAAVIIGGTSMFGGSGSVIGSLIGASIMTVLTNAMVLMNVSIYWQNIVVGAIIIFAVGVDTYRRNKLFGSRC